jgi:hypothetical protein
MWWTAMDGFVTFVFSRRAMNKDLFSPKPMMRLKESRAVELKPLLPALEPGILSVLGADLQDDFLITFPIDVVQ